MAKWKFTVMALLACGCGDGAEAAESDSNLERVGLQSCDTLSPAACGNDERCTVIHGQQWDESSSCASDALDPIGCMDSGNSCPAAIMYASSPSGSQYQIVSGCVPAGFTSFQPADPSGRQCNTGCESLGVDDCEKDAGCMTMGGQLLDDTRQCFRAVTPLMCRTKPVGCTTAFTEAKDPQGRIWKFTGGGPGCVPYDFTEISGSHALPACE